MSKTSKPLRDDVRARRLGESPTHLLHRALQLALDLHAQASGVGALTQRQHTVLAAAAASEGQTQNALVRATGIDRSTLADLVARLLAKGLLERQRSQTDARAKTVRLSPAGRAALDESATAAQAADDRLLAMLPGKKQETFLKALGLLAGAADGEPPPGRKAKAIKSAAAPGERRVRAAKPAKPAKLDRKKKRKKTKHP